jgi:tetratricopeptide (TPR) repeat protein
MRPTFPTSRGPTITSLRATARSGALTGPLWHAPPRAVNPQNPCAAGVDGLLYKAASEIVDATGLPLFRSANRKHSGTLGKLYDAFRNHFQRDLSHWRNERVDKAGANFTKELIDLFASKYEPADEDRYSAFTLFLSNHKPELKAVLTCLERYYSRQTSAKRNQLGKTRNFDDDEFDETPLKLWGECDAIMDIENGLKKTGAVALTGIPGVGKTAQVRRYATVRGDRYERRYLILANDDSVIPQRLYDIGVKQQLIRSDEPLSAWERVKRQLKGVGKPLLLIFDDALPADDLAKFLPNEVGTGVHILISSNYRSNRWGRYNITRVEIKEWDDATGGAYFVQRVRANQDPEAAKQLSRELGGLPLALEAAARYCEDNDVTAEEFLGEIKREQITFLEPHLPPEYPRGLARTFSLLVNKSAAQHPGAQYLIKYLACLAQGPIPRSLFQDDRGALHAGLSKVLVGSGFRRSVAALSQFSLLETRGAQTLNLHSLWRLVARSVVETGGQLGEVRGSLITALAEAFPPTWNTSENWTLASEFDAHVRALVKISEITIPQDTRDATAVLIDKFASFLSQLGQYRDARPYFEMALKIRPEAARYHSRLASCLHSLWCLTEARRHFRRAVTTAARAGDRSLHFYFNDYSLLLRARAWAWNEGPHKNRLWALAQHYALRAFKIRKEMLRATPRVPEEKYDEARKPVATSLNNLGLIAHDQGLIAHDQGRLALAERLFRRALAIREEVFGLHHPQTARFRNNLGRLLLDKGNLPAAGTYLRDALTDRMASLGELHHETAATVVNLASLLQIDGRLDEAREKYDETRKIDETAFGGNHPFVAEDCTNIGLLLRATASRVSDREEQAKIHDDARLHFDRASKILKARRHDVGDHVVKEAERNLIAYNQPPDAGFVGARWFPRL